MAELISIIIPSYNHGRFIGEAINSVLRQTYNNWEIIIVDNNSNDNTDQVLAKYNDIRIKVYKINNNGIIAKSRNLGIKLSKGRWVAFLDSDDWWTDDKLEIVVNTIKNNPDLIYHRLRIVYNGHNYRSKVLKSKVAKNNITKDLLINGNYICNSSVIIKRNIIERVGFINEDLELVGSEDYNTLLKISQITNNFVYIPKTLGYYRYHNDGVSKKDMSISINYATKDFLCVLKNTKKYYGRVNYIKAVFELSKKNYKSSLILLSYSLKHATLNIKIKSFYFVLIAYISLVWYKMQLNVKR